jgi:putative flippase GtrA
MTLRNLVLRYALFAGTAIAINIVSQTVMLHLYNGWFKLTAAMIVGTGAGLVTKYVLDKYWIFSDFSQGVAAHARRFLLYATTGLLTTAFFWGMEYLFNGLTPDGRWRFLGAIIGLTIGYIAKYFLDRRFVFSGVKV